MKFYDYLINKAHDDGIERLLIAGIIINNKSEILILTRKSESFMGGINEIPSGNINVNETIEETLIRVIKDEINLEVNDIKYYINSFDYLSYASKKARQFNFLITVENLDDIVITKHAEYQLLTIDDCRNNNKITDELKETLEIVNFNFLQKKIK